MDEKKKKFNLFNFLDRDGKGVEKSDVIHVLDKPNIQNYFKLLGRKLSKLLSVNMFFVFGNFPVLFALFAIAGFTSTPLSAPSSALYTALFGSLNFDVSPLTASLNGIFGIQAQINLPTPLTYVFYILALLVFFTFGPVNVGCTYILRNMVREEPIFMWKDFWYAIKRNLRQGIIFGFLDLFFCIMLVYDTFWFRSNMGQNGFMTFLYFISFAMIFIYFFLRMYTYLMMITFDLSFLKLIKNSVFFAVLGIKRNVMFLIATVLIVGINYALFLIFMPIGIILPFILTPAILAFTSVYCAYPKIKEIMIDPYYKEVNDPEDTENE